MGKYLSDGLTNFTQIIHPASGQYYGIAFQTPGTYLVTGDGLNDFVTFDAYLWGAGGGSAAEHGGGGAAVKVAGIVPSNPSVLEITVGAPGGNAGHNYSGAGAGGKSYKDPNDTGVAQGIGSYLKNVPASTVGWLVGRAIGTTWDGSTYYIERTIYIPRTDSYLFSYMAARTVNSVTDTAVTSISISVDGLERGNNTAVGSSANTFALSLTQGYHKIQIIGSANNAEVNEDAYFALEVSTTNEDNLTAIVYSLKQDQLSRASLMGGTGGTAGEFDRDGDGGFQGAGGGGASSLKMNGQLIAIAAGGGGSGGIGDDWASSANNSGQAGQGQLTDFNVVNNGSSPTQFRHYTNPNYCQFLNDHGIWNYDVNSYMLDATFYLFFPSDGRYTFEASCDNYADIYLDDTKILHTSGYSNVNTITPFVKAGIHAVKLHAVNVGGPGSIAATINYPSVLTDLNDPYFDQVVLLLQNGNENSNTIVDKSYVRIPVTAYGNAEYTPVVGGEAGFSDVVALIQGGVPGSTEWSGYFNGTTLYPTPKAATTSTIFNFASTTMTLGDNSTKDLYSAFTNNSKTLAVPPTGYGTTVGVFGFSGSIVTPYDRFFKASNKVDLSDTASVNYYINKGTSAGWGEDPDQSNGDNVYLEYSTNGTTWVVIDTVTPNTVNPNVWTQRIVNLPVGARLPAGVYLRFRNPGVGGNPAPRDTWAVSNIIATSDPNGEWRFLHDGLNDWTIETWFNTSVTGPNQYQHICYTNGSTNGNGFWLGLNDQNGHVGDATASVELYFIPYQDTYRVINTQANVWKVGEWNHLAVTFNSSTSEVKIYVNGVSQTLRTTDNVVNNGGAFAFSQYNPSNSLRIGPMNGWMSDFRIVKDHVIYSSNFTPASSPTSTVSGTYLQVLQDPTFLDRSPNEYTFTTNGVYTTMVSPFGVQQSNQQLSWSGKFDGTGDYLTLPAHTSLRLGSTYTVEAFVWCNAYGANNRIFGALNRPSGLDLGIYGNGTFFINGGTANSSYQLPKNRWVHIALVMNAGVPSLYADGVKQNVTGQLTGHNHTDLNPVSIGFLDPAVWNGAADSYHWNGYISNVRFVKGIAVYTSNFSIPNAPLTAITGTVLLTLQDSTFVDNSGLNFTITPHGNVKTDRSNPFQGVAGITDGSYYNNTLTISGNPVFGTPDSAAFPNDPDNSSIFINAPNDYNSNEYIQVSPVAGEFVIGANQDFTIEGWFNLRDNPTYQYQTIWELGYYSDGILFRVGPSTNGLWINNNNLVSGTQLTQWFPYGSWHHFAIVRRNGTITLYANGVSKYSTSSITGAINTWDGPWIIGRSQHTAYQHAPAMWIDDFRFTLGRARYTTNFTRPSSRFKNYQYEVAYKFPNDSTTVASLQLDGVLGTYVETASSEDLVLTGDFTIEGWFFMRNHHTGVGSGYPQVEGLFELNYYTDGILLRLGRPDSPYRGGDFYVNGRNYAGYIENYFPFGQWNHIAVVRSGSTVTLYGNGQVIVAAKNVSGTINSAGGPLRLGNTRHYAHQESPNMWVDDFRITNGTARYTAAFTPPTARFSAVASYGSYLFDTLDIQDTQHYEPVNSKGSNGTYSSLGGGGGGGGGAAGGAGGSGGTYEGSGGYGGRGGNSYVNPYVGTGRDVYAGSGTAPGAVSDPARTGSYGYYAQPGMVVLFFSRKPHVWEKIDGSWKRMDVIKYKVPNPISTNNPNGTKGSWKEVGNIYYKVNGKWKRVFAAAAVSSTNLPDSFG